MPFPNPPSKIVPFNSGPVAPHDIGRQFDEHRRASAEVIEFLRTVVRDDGRPVNGSVGLEQLTPDLPEMLAKRAVDALSELLESIKSQASEATAALFEVRRVKTEIERARHAVANSAKEAMTARDQAKKFSATPVRLETRSSAPPLPTGALGPNAGGFYGVDKGAAPTAQDYAQVSIEWAEHMPDIIPPNVLAINAITGEHWSSRWWAMKASNAFGMMSMLYCGASDVPPTETLIGDPLTPGCIYFDTNTNMMMVWNGSAWQPFSVPQKAFTASLYYVASANQQQFPLATPDLYNNVFTLNQQDPEGVECYVNGSRLTPDNNPGLLTGDFFVSLQNNSITLGQPLPAGAMVAVDILQTASQLAPGAVAIHPCVNINTPPGTQNGTLATFVLTVKSDGTHPNLAGPEELLVSLDGVLQEPGIQYAATGDSITFNQAPAPDAYVFISWFKTPLNNTALGETL